MLQQVMTTQTTLGQTLKGARRTGKFTDYFDLVRMLGRQMILQCLTSSTLVITMLALMLECSIMLSLDMHMNRALILLGEVTVRALELS